MTARLDLLSDREKAALRLLGQGHDVKSAARSLDVSVHTINERLRDARAKLGVTSSRAAARLLIEGEGGQEICPEKTGVGAPAPASEDRRRLGQSVRGSVHLVIGVTLMSIGALLATLFLSATPAMPSVVASTPPSDAIVPPGPLVVTVTYDQPMRRDSYSVVSVTPDTYPRCDDRPTLSADRRTFTLRCTVEAGRTYEMWFNRGRFSNFRAVTGLSATPHRLTFRTR